MKNNWALLFVRQIYVYKVFRYIISLVKYQSITNITARCFELIFWINVLYLWGTEAQLATAIASRLLLLYLLSCP